MEGFSHEEKREVFDRLISIESELKHLSVAIDKLPCFSHQEKIAANTLNLEKSKWTTIGLLFAIVAGGASLASTVYGFFK
jgi:hypothetical protein